MTAIQLRYTALVTKNSPSQGRADGLQHISSILWTEPRTVTLKGAKLTRGCLLRRSGVEGGRQRKERETAMCAAETSKQSPAQMPLLISTQHEADVYQDNPERKSQPKPERFTFHKQGISWGKEWQVMGSANFSS